MPITKKFSGLNVFGNSERSFDFLIIFQGLMILQYKFEKVKCCKDKTSTTTETRTKKMEQFLSSKLNQNKS